MSRRPWPDGAHEAHEAVTRGGFGAELSAQIHSELFNELAGPVARVGGANTPVPYASSLEQNFLPVSRIEPAVRALLGQAKGT